MDTRSCLESLTLAFALALSACSDPYADRPSTGPRPPESTSPGARAAAPAPVAGDARPAEPTPAPPSGGRRLVELGPRTLARAYAHRVINWDWHTLPDRLAALRQLTAGSLSAELRDAIAAAESDESLSRDRASSHGTVVAVAVHGGGRSQRLVIVTRERETVGGAEAIGPATHRVYLGRARSGEDGWRMIAWQRAP